MIHGDNVSGIDLHTHSTASDGTLPPAALVRQAKKLGLKALALTDHDTIAGNSEALAAGEREGVEVVAGCELSVEYKPGFMHILGLFVPENPQRLMDGMQYLNDLRESRNTRVVEKLQSLGLDVTYDELLEVADGGTVGRPHLARVLMNKGYVDSIDEAFAVYLGKKGKAYLPKEKFTPEKAIELLVSEGATVVLAHPYSLGLSTAALERELKWLMELGLEGIECLYPLHDASQTRNFIALAEKLGLLVTGGSDFHGENKPEIHLGMTANGKDVPYALLESIKEHRLHRGLPV
jgi:hypothetical protein